MPDSLQPHDLQHPRLLYTLLISRSLLKLMSIESGMPSNHLNLCHSILLLPSIFPSIRVFSNELFLASGDQSIGAAAPATVLQMNIQGWFPLGLTGVISLLSKGLSRVFSNTTVRKHQFFGAQPSLLQILTNINRQIDSNTNAGLSYLISRIFV